MFIRVYNKSEQKEILVNVANIWKIEVTYVVPDPKTRMGFETSLQQGIENPDAIRVYKVFFGGDTVLISALPPDNVTKVLEDIYKNAVKGG